LSRGLAVDRGLVCVRERYGGDSLPTRLLVGLHLLKHIKALSDEQVCAQWVENPYFQAFCGETYFQHELPLERGRVPPGGVGAVGK
jgi:hypothetical protein